MRNNIVKFLHLLHDFDTNAKDLEVKSNLEGVRENIIKIMSFTASGVLAICLGTSATFYIMFYYSASYLMPLRYCYVLFYMSLLILQFSFATLAIKSRFCLLNDNLKFTFQNSPRILHSSVNVHAKGYDERLPIIISNLYGNLFDGIDLVNDSFTFQLIPFMLYYLTTNLFAIHSMIRETFNGTPLMYIAFGTNIWWIFMHTGMVSIALYSSCTTTRCALKAPIIVSSIVKGSKWKESHCVINVFKTFLVEVQYRNMFFENEFFRIDWKLLFSVS